MPKRIHLFNLPFFVILIGIYPVLTLLGHNIDQVIPTVAIRPLLVCLLLAVGLWGILFVLLRDWHRSALIASIILILFYSYGHVFNALAGARLSVVLHGLNRYLVVVTAIVLIAVVVPILRTRRQLTNLVQILNIISLVLIVFPSYQLVDYALRSYRASQTPHRQNLSIQASQTPPYGGSEPDIYYIILDTYSRDDVLKSEFGYDNQPFIKSLEKIGFVVGRCAQSNFSMTPLSIASSLNMNYIQELGDFPKNSYDIIPVLKMVQKNAVMAYVKQHGYKTVAMSASNLVNVQGADVYISTDEKDLPAQIEGSRVNSFEAMFIKDTALVLLTNIPGGKSSAFLQDVKYPFNTHIRQQQYILRSLKRIPDISGPKFVFVHVMIPHPPYVFSPNGDIIPDPPPFPEDKANPTPRERIKALYVGQVEFINSRMLDIVKNILSRPGLEPIIILQGDHGEPEEPHMPILNAIYLPKDQRKGLYPQMSPVNTFRYIFNHNLGGNYKMLPDISYQSLGYGRPYSYAVRPDLRDGCAANK